MSATAEHLEKRQHFSRWTAAVLLLIAAIIFFSWAGSAANPAAALPWVWTKSGWIIPAAGLGMLWIAAVLLFWVLSGIAYLLFNPLEGAVKLKPWLSTLLILGGGIVLRAVILHAWTPLHLQNAAPGERWLPAIGDAVVIVLLLLALAGTGRSFWWASLYAFHPLVLLEIAGNGHETAWWITAVIFAAATAHRWPWVLRTIAMIFAAAAVVAAISLLSARGSQFNSLAADACSALNLNGAIVLPILAAITEALLLWIAVARRWALARALIHILLIALLLSPVVYPWFVVPAIALLPLAWNSAAWVLSLTVMGTYIALLVPHRAGQLHVPEWALILEWTPVAVMECCEIILDLNAAFSRRQSASPSAAPTSALS